jgi:hypothetical protein
MPARLLADLVVLAHAVFVAFVVLGGLAVFFRPRIAWVHVPAAAWGVIVEYSGALCPLTPLEIELRRRGGEAGYSGGFIEQYLVAALYPEGLTREWQIALGTAALAINVAIYGWLLGCLRAVRLAGVGSHATRRDRP